jgi:hypothetical protein
MGIFDGIGDFFGGAIQAVGGLVQDVFGGGGGGGSKNNKVQEIVVPAVIEKDIVSNINKTMNTTFTNKYSNKAEQSCQQNAIQSQILKRVKISGFDNVDISNILYTDLACILNSNTKRDIKSDIASSLDAAMKKELGTELYNKLDQDAKTQFGSSGKGQSTTTSTETNDATITTVSDFIDFKVNTDISDSAIQTAIQEISQSKYFEDVDLTGNGRGNLTIMNKADVFLKSTLISTCTDAIISSVVSSQVVQEDIEAKTKVQNEMKQKLVAGGFGELLESFGTMFGNIFSGGLTPIIIIVCVVILIFMFFLFGSQSSSQPQYSPYGMPQPQYSPYGMPQPQPQYSPQPQPQPQYSPQPQPQYSPTSPYGMPQYQQAPPLNGSGFFGSIAEDLSTSMIKKGRKK